MSQLKIVEAIADACDDKNAENIVVLNMEHISLVADYFLICHANNERQVQAIARAVKETLAEKEIMIDRKSTRLNSSHVAISYAVFCLKKKRCTDTDKTRA